jgi:hypothetical protein
MIHMMHPQHGEMDCYLEAEAAANEKNGWKRVVAESVVIEATPAPVPDELIPSFVRRGPGRPRKDS